MKRNKNVIFFVTSLNNGGLENYLLRFIQDYNNRFDKIYVWCKGAKGGVLEDDYSSFPNVDVVKVSLNSIYFWEYKKLIQFIKTQKINIVCDFTGSFSGLTMLSAKMVGVPVRLVFYRNANDKFKKVFFKIYYRKLLQKLVKKCSTKILSNSKAAFDYFYPLRNLNNDKFKVIYNGINSKNFETSFDKDLKLLELGLPKNAFIIGHVGRFNYQKNHLTILKAFNSLIKKHDNIYIIFCGSGTKEGVLHLVDEINSKMHDKVKILGNRGDVNELLKIMNLFFFPSIIEGQPNALIEAMISGIPIVSSNIGPIIETTPKYMHAFLKDPYDVDGFVEIISEIYESPSLKNKFIFSDWAKNKYNFEERFNEFYDELNY